MTKTNIKIVEVSPRDGLQNESNQVPTDIKLALIDRLIKAGCTIIEATSFVSPKWVPQMSDHASVVDGLPKKDHLRFPVLVPNLQGLEKAMAHQVKDIAVFVAASESFSKKNINCTIDDSLARVKEVADLAQKNQIAIRGYVSCVLGCPYEGEIDPHMVARVAKQLYEAGCFEISLGDTIGVGTPNQAKQLVAAVSEVVPINKLAIHFHDTYGQALANIYACLDLGIRTIDSSVAGLGGCPYAKGASGNVATEDVVYMLEGLGFHSGLDLSLLIDAGNMICDYLKRPNLSKVAQARITQ